MNRMDQVRLAGTEHATRRHFLKESLGGLAALWCGIKVVRGSPDHAHSPTVRGQESRAQPDLRSGTVDALAHRPAQIAAKAKRVIFLHMSGAPSQLELFEHKPELVTVHKEAQNFELASQSKSASPVPYHPGAAKYFAEKGVNVK